MPLHKTAAATQARSACTTAPAYNTIHLHTAAAARSAATGACVPHTVYGYHRTRLHVEGPDAAYCVRGEGAQTYQIESA
eukprot:956621-Pyramimonas_sp.AAC.1